MSKGLTAGLILMLSILVIGSEVFPNNSSMWLASVELSMNIIRLVMITLLLAVFFTDPPRSRQLRALFGVAAVAMVSWTGMQLAWHSTYLLDMLVFLQAAIIFALEAIEYQPSEEEAAETAEEPASAFRRTIMVTTINEPMAPVKIQQTFEAVPKLARRLLSDTGQRYRQGRPLWLRRLREQPGTYLRRYSHHLRTAQNPPHT